MFSDGTALAARAFGLELGAMITTDADTRDPGCSWQPRQVFTVEISEQSTFVCDCLGARQKRWL